MELLEGLKEGDLKGLVQSKITIDEFKSKLSDDGLVVGIFVLDKEPANDLNRFIQKSSLEMLDTEVSPAPDTNGYYLVFLEFVRDNKFPKLLLDVLRMVETLTGVKKWTASCFKDKTINELNIRTIRKNVRLVPVEQQTTESLYRFFKPSLLDDLRYKNKTLTLVREDKEFIITIEDFGHIDLLTDRYQLNENVQEQRADVANLERIIRWFLGETWCLTSVNKKLMLQRIGSNAALLIS